MWSLARLVWTGIREKAVLWKTPEAIQALQQRRLRALVDCARSRSPYYAEQLRGIDPHTAELAQLPILTKAEMMGQFDRFLTDRRLQRSGLEAFMRDPARLSQWYLGKYAVSHTSGTSGMQAYIVQDRRMMELLFALQIMRGSVFTIAPLDMAKQLMQRTRLAAITIGRGFYPSAVALAYRPPACRTFMNQLWLTHFEPIEDVVEQLNRFQPHVLLAYANVLEILAREALAGRLRLGQQAPLRQVINFSEPLSEGANNLVRQAFGLPITNNYALGECMALSTSCPRGHGMHLNADWAILEVVDRRNQPVEPGRPGEKVLMTNLYNHVQPFIRYEVPDVVTLSPTPCPCGNPLPLIVKVEGRTDELIWIRDGDRFRQIHPYVFVDVLDEYPPLGWYQLIQVERNRLLLRAMAAPGQTIRIDELRGLLDRGFEQYGLAGLVHVDIEITDRIAPDPKSGKLKRITSRLGHPDEHGETNPARAAS
jgi:phenylacetate-coenzyme A ligase PaaK-like adenylate-forming protein